MSSQVVVGTQWGDEGKGKIVDVLAEKAKMIVRFQGGDNAGHTVVVHGQKHVLHLLPSGVLHPKATCVIGPGVVCNPFVLLEEMATLEKSGLTTDHIVISDRAHILMPYHVYQDQLEEQANGAKIGTTKRGIGPCYADKYKRTGIRYHELIDFDAFAKRLKECLTFKNELFTKLYEQPALDYDKMLADFRSIHAKIVPMIQETTHLVNEALDQDEPVLFEGAQAAMLDINYGTYPFVTSSSPTSAGVTEGAGIAPNRIDKVIGVVKAYSSRVGEGPFVTEQLNEMGDWLREQGREFGATTGRPRRTGWLDLLVVKHANMMNGLTDLVITKIDILTGLKEILACVAYEIDGQCYDYIPSDPTLVAKAKPIYQRFPGWTEDISQVRNYEQLPANCKVYLEAIAQFVGVPITMVSVGPDRENNIWC